MKRARLLPPLLAALAAGCFVGADEEDAAKDRDRDGYLSAEVGGDDCDDGDADVYPGALESCVDDVDSDCDGATCPARIDVQLGDQTWARGEEGGDALRVSGVADLDGDGAAEVILSALGAETGEGVIHVVRTPTPLSISLSDDTASIKVLAEGGVWAHPVGDLDADGDDELLIATRTGPGRIWLLDDDFDGAGDVTALPTLGVDGEDGEVWPFGGVQPLGDWDGDGDDDFMVFSPGDGPGGAAYLLTDPFPDAGALPEVAHAKIAGGNEDDAFGAGTGAALDADGDGKTDILVVVPGADFYGSGAPEPAWEDIGAALIFSWALSGDVPPHESDASIGGLHEETPIQGATGLGDLNGDGHDDLGVYLDSGPGDFLIFHGPLEGHLGLNDADVRLVGDAGETETGAFGEHAISEDVDGDGQGDLLVAAPLEGLGETDSEVGPDHGAAYLFLGPVFGVSGPDHAAARWRGGLRSGKLEQLAVYDVDADAALDLLLSLPGNAENPAHEPPGAVQIAWSAFEELGL